MTLVPLDAETLPASKPMQEVAVSTYLEHAKTWLASAVEATGPEHIAQAKAQIATAAEATKQLGLSKEIQLDAEEMVRRAEYALDRAIRQAQAAGDPSVKSLASGGPRGPYERGGVIVNAHPDPKQTGMSPRALFGGNSQARSEAYQMGSASAEDFESALNEAKAEGNLSRANVVRKVRKQDGPTTRDQRADLIVKLANQGYSSRQMPAKVGVSEEWIRQTARDYGIEIPADRSVGGTRRINSTQVVVNTATALEGLLAGIELVDFGDLDLDEASQWAASLTDSTKKLARFAQQIRKATQ
jgi:hypothetical protein